MKVLVTQPKGKAKLVEYFKKECELVKLFEPINDDIKLIVPTVDEELWFFSRARDWFKSKGITVAVSPEFAVSTCRDKAEFYRFCRRHNFDTPITYQIEGIIKPRFGKGSKEILKVNRSSLVQEFVDWPEYSIDYYKDEKVLSIIPRLRLEVVNGESKDGVIVDDERLVKEAERLGNELGLEYHNVMQCFYNGQEIKWLEVNCRYGGGSWLTFGRFNSPAHLVNMIEEMC